MKGFAYLVFFLDKTERCNKQQSRCLTRCAAVISKTSADVGQDNCLAPLPTQSCAPIRCQSAQTRLSGSNMRLGGSCDTAFPDGSSLDVSRL